MNFETISYIEPQEIFNALHLTQDQIDEVWEDLSNTDISWGNGGQKTFCYADTILMIACNILDEDNAETLVKDFEKSLFGGEHQAYDTLVSLD